MSEERSRRLRIRVWDLPLRLFHWLLATAFAVAWLTHGDRWLHVHVFAGYAIAALLSFRVVWGFAGGHHGRFRNFVYGWADVRAYLACVFSRTPPHFPGHNPAGSWAVYALLGLTAATTLTGILALGGEERHGPLAGLLTFAQGEAAHRLHDWLAWTLLALVVAHLVGVAVESYLQRENLPRTMLTGYKTSNVDAASCPAHRPIAAALVASLTAGGFLYFQDALYASPDRLYLPFTGPALPDNATWRGECGSCHLAYPPSLLPARSWQQMMAGQQAHFGEDLAFDAQTAQSITRFLADNAAETLPTESAWKIMRSTPAAETPLRITETRYWKQKHDFPPSAWQAPGVKRKHDCGACHLDAERGAFEDGAMRLPE